MDPETKKLVEEYAPLAQSIAHRFVSKYPPYIDRDAFYGAAYEGLCRAALSFDPEKGPFKAWAVSKIIARMRDEMRTLDHLTRTQRAKLNPEHRSYDPEFRISASPLAPTSFDDVRNLSNTKGRKSEDDVTLAEMVRDVNSPDPGESVLMTHDQLFGLMAHLPDKEFRVLTLRYLGGMRIVDIARSMTISPSRVSQLESVALQRIRREIA